MSGLYFSTTSALLKLTNHIFNGFNNNILTGALFIDLTTAFDMVDHYLLLDKLYSIGLNSSSILRFNSYLHLRRQCVSFRGSHSDFHRQRGASGFLGPLLFSIFINDLPLTCMDCHIQVYADDAIIYSSSKSNFTDVQHSLQHGFDKIQFWLQANKLLLNKTKSHSILFHKKLDPYQTEDLILHVWT